MERSPLARSRPRRWLAVVPAALLASTCWAGRPLTVDDADVAEVGGGQVESWYARQPDRSRTWTTAVGVTVYRDVELGAALERNIGGEGHATELQLKVRLTPTVEGGCNAAAVFGTARANHGGGRTHLVNGLVTCNLADAVLHANLGANRGLGASTLPTWGVAAEKALGAVTAHVEYFGQRKAGPTLQAGLRTELADNLQLDGTIGRAERRLVFSVGLQLSF